MFDVKDWRFAGNHMLTDDVALNAVAMLLARHLRVFGHKPSPTRTLYLYSGPSR
jgi:hypothetical protein